MRNSCTYKISGTKTFRLSSSKILGKWGGNLQNIEKSMREIYIPDEGKIFVQVDQSGAEALVVAYLATAGKFRDLFLHNVKPHVYVALKLFKDKWKKKLHEHKLITSSDNFDINSIIETPIKELKSIPLWKNLESIIKDSDNWSLRERYYYLAKQTCHSGNYGITPPTFRMNVLEKSGGKIVLEKEEAERFILTYQSEFPEIFEWHNVVRRQVEQHKMLFNLHGHPYTITQPEIMESAWKELYAWIPQSTVGEITNIAYAKLQDYIEETGKQWDLLANTHDSYMLQCPIGEQQEAGLKMQEFMNQTFRSPADGSEFKMKSEAQAGFNWAPAKKDKNLTGLREL
jgi:DNA polymerase I-like protein with 3'-5' exonuclease and polymerase domains